MVVYTGRTANILIGSNIASATKIGTANSASLEIATGLEPYYPVGGHTPYAIVAGNQEITGSLSELWLDVERLKYLRTSTKTALSEFYLIFKAQNVAGAPYIYAKQCYVETLSFDISQDGTLTQDLDFRAVDWEYEMIP